MRRVLAQLAPVLAAVSLSGCVVGGGEPPPLPPLAQDQAQPELALLEHVLTGYFARAGASGPTVCAGLSPTSLNAAQEQALIARFVRLAPAERCLAVADRWTDAITGEAAEVVQVYDFACRSETLCTGWARAPGVPAMRYAMRFENGTWRFDGDPRIIAE